MSDPRPRPFPFLALPKELRLMIYGRLPVITRRHAIQFHQNHEDFALTLVSKRVPGISIFATCRQIYEEATVLRTKMDALNAEPTRIVTHWRTIGSKAMKAVLRCTSRREGGCGGNTDLEYVLQQAREHKLEMSHTRRDDKNKEFSRIWGTIFPHDSLPGFMFEPTVLHCDFSDHDELHAILRRSVAPGARRRIEIAVVCTKSLRTGLCFLRTGCTYFYMWLSDMHYDRTGDFDMHINLLPMPETHVEKVLMELKYAFWNKYNPPSSFRGRRWSYELGDWVEWVETWEQGAEF
ncbi:Nn.00g008390.m01.CDS01 [Neocucurbitaria sp. VM-36]